MNNNIILFSSIIATISLIAPILSANNNVNTDVHKISTENEPNGLRFQRILRRKKRFLLFPPGSAIVVCILHCKQNIFYAIK